MYATDVTGSSIGWDPTGTTSVTAATTPIGSLATGYYQVPAGTYLVSADATVPSGVVLDFAKGATLKPASTKTVTLTEEPVAGLWKIFDRSAGGTARITRAGEVPVEWLGAAGDNSTDDSGAIQATIDLVEAAGGGVVRLAARQYYLSSGVSIDTSQISLRGVGKAYAYGTVGHVTTLRAAGGIDALTLACPTSTTISDGCVENLLFQDGARGIKVTGGDSLGLVRFTFRDLVFHFQTVCGIENTSYEVIYCLFENLLTHGCKTGVKLAGAINANTFINCQFRRSGVDGADSAGEYGLSILGDSSLSATANTLLNCVFESNYGTGLNLLNTKSFTMMGGWFENNGAQTSIAGGPYPAVRVEAIGEEVESIEFIGVSAVTDGANDGSVFVETASNQVVGPYRFRGCRFGSGATVALGAFAYRPRLFVEGARPAVSGSPTREWTVDDGGNVTLLGSFAHRGGGTTLGFNSATPVTKPAAYTQYYTMADRTLGPYTSDPEGSAYSGIASGVSGAPYAQATDLNALRAAYENLRAFTEDLAQQHNAMLDDLQAYGLL